MSRRKSLRELASEADGEPMQIGGAPADKCPHCGCGMFVTGTRQGEQVTFRYVTCRNPACGKRFLSKQPKPAPATIVREVGDDDASNAGQNAFRVFGETG